MPRKHVILGNINKQQQVQSKIWQKLAREIKVAAKTGGPNPEGNPRLKVAVDKALQNGLSKDSIEKNIHGSSKDPTETNTLEFECYGPEGLQIIVNALSDNTNRTIANLNGFLSKLHGQIAKQNSVKIFFNLLGDIVLDKTPGLSVNDIEDFILEKELDGYIETVELDDAWEIFTTPDDNFYKIKEEINKKGWKILDAEIKLIPQNPVTTISQESKERLEKFIISCENDDDITNVVTNYQPEE